MQKKILAVAVSGALFASFNACAEGDGNWMMRVRAVHVDWADKSGSIGALAVPANGIHLEEKTIPEVDFSYFFTKNLAAELILTYPQKHAVRVTQSAAGAFNAGSLKELPPTLTLQYHFTPDAQFRPYVGAGFNYTRFSAVNLAPLNTVSGGANTLDKSSFGGALQAGFDVKVGANSYINFDVKKVYIQTDLTNSALGKISTIKADPLLVGIGYGFKF
ncbi:MAG: outer membrane beta-barrel protein [Gallionellaceae bacterium]|nr:outer membrane beta-barrel protein [Gallionellaceae bacterium]